MIRQVSASALVVALLAVGATGCCSKLFKGSGGDSGTTSTGANTPGEITKIDAAGVQFNAPGGWTKYGVGEWVRFKSPSGDAMLGFVPYTGDATSKIGDIAQQFGMLGSPKWNGGTVPSGPYGVFKGSEANGTCALPNLPNVEIRYALVDTGSNTKLLLVYLAAQNASNAKNKKDIQAAVSTLRKI
ncbi:MAG: hypothetical protein U0165_06575 [Polyangiaceae bacterium]